MNQHPLTPAGDMDDMADHAMTLHTSEGGYRVDTRRPFIPQGCDQQGRLKPTIQPAEACTELGCDDDDDTDVSGALKWPVLMILGICLVALAWNLAGVVA